MCFDWVSSPTRGLLWMFSPGKFLLLQSFTDWRNIRLCRYPLYTFMIVFHQYSYRECWQCSYFGRLFVYLKWIAVQELARFFQTLPPNFSIAGTFHTQVQRKSGGFFAVFCFCFGWFWDLVSRVGWGFRHFLNLNLYGMIMIMLNQ